jgi:hypothetical protein
MERGFVTRLSTTGRTEGPRIVRASLSSGVYAAGCKPTLHIETLSDLHPSLGIDPLHELSLLNERLG